MSTKRVNFNMAAECHALLKSVCAMKGITVSEYCYDLIAADFERLVRTDTQVRELFLNGSYPFGSRAHKLQQQILNEKHL